MSQLSSATKCLEYGINIAKTPLGIYAVTRTWIDTMFAVGWGFDDVNWGISKVQHSFVEDTKQHKILNAFYETELDLLPKAMLIRCGYEEVPDD